MSSREFTAWLAYYGLEPFGEERDDLRMATIASLLANANRDPKKRAEPYSPADFMPKFDQTDEADFEEHWKRQKAVLMSMTR